MMYSATLYFTVSESLPKNYAGAMQLSVPPATVAHIRTTPQGRADMPTPLQILLDPVSLTVLGLYGALILLEALFPARILPQVKGWKTRALVVFVCYFYLSSYLPLLWGDTLARYQLFNLESLNPFAGAGIAVLIYELLVYVW